MRIKANIKLVQPLLLRSLINTDNHGVVTLERLERKLLLGLNAHLPQLCDFLCEYGFRRRGRIDTVGLDGDDDTSADLQEQTSIKTDNTSLIRLGNIGKDAVDHANEHAVLERVTGVLNDGDDVCAVGGHVDQITARAVRKLNSEDGALGANNISDVRDTGSRCGTKVEDLASRAHVDIVDTTKDTSCQFTPEGVPHAVFGAARGRIIAFGGSGSTNADALLAVNALTRSQVLGH